MKPMNPVTVKSFTWLAAILMVIAFTVMSPSGAMVFAAAAALAALLPSMGGRGIVRVIAAILLLLSIGLSLTKYPTFKNELDGYRHRQDTTIPQKAQPG